MAAEDSNQSQSGCTLAANICTVCTYTDVSVTETLDDIIQREKAKFSGSCLILFIWYSKWENDKKDLLFHILLIIIIIILLWILCSDQKYGINVRHVAMVTSLPAKLQLTNCIFWNMWFYKILVTKWRQSRRRSSHSSFITGSLTVY